MRALTAYLPWRRQQETSPALPIDQWLERWFQEPTWSEVFDRGSWTAPYDIDEKDDGYVMHVEVPGWDAKDLDVEVSGNRVAIDLDLGPHRNPILVYRRRAAYPAASASSRSRIRSSALSSPTAMLSTLALLLARLLWGLSFAALNIATQALATAEAVGAGRRSGRSRAIISTGPMVGLLFAAVFAEMIGPSVQRPALVDAGHPLDEGTQRRAVVEHERVDDDASPGGALDFLERLRRGPGADPPERQRPFAIQPPA